MILTVLALAGAPDPAPDWHDVYAFVVEQGGRFDRSTLAVISAREVDKGRFDALVAEIEGAWSVGDSARLESVFARLDALTGRWYTLTVNVPAAEERVLWGTDALLSSYAPTRDVFIDYQYNDSLWAYTVRDSGSDFIFKSTDDGVSWVYVSSFGHSPQLIREVSLVYTGDWIQPVWAWDDWVNRVDYWRLYPDGSPDTGPCWYEAMSFGGVGLNDVGLTTNRRDNPTYTMIVTTVSGGTVYTRYSSNTGCDWVGQLAVDAAVTDDPDVIYDDGTGNTYLSYEKNDVEIHVARSANLGQTWTPTAPVLSPPDTNWQPKVSAYAGNVMVVYTHWETSTDSMVIYRNFSTDGGVTWSAAAPIYPEPLWQEQPDVSLRGNGLARVSFVRDADGAVFYTESTDYSAWTPPYAVNDYTADVTVDPSIATTPADMCAVIGYTALTNQFAYSDHGCTPVGIGGEEGGERTGLTLRVTRRSGRLVVTAGFPSTERARLSVYDVAGRLVVRLLDDAVGGEARASWAPPHAGAYVLRLTSGDEALSRVVTAKP